jgi:hypothetical protein
VPSAGSTRSHDSHGSAKKMSTLRRMQTRAANKNRKGISSTSKLNASIRMNHILPHSNAGKNVELASFYKRHNNFMKSSKNVPAHLKNVDSPTRKLIQVMEGRIQEFDINKVMRWSLDEVKKYRIYIN